MRIDDAGDVGDLIFSIVKAGWLSVLVEDVVLAESPLLRLCFRLRVLSSLLSRIRTERLPCGNSSEEDEVRMFGRVLTGLSSRINFSRGSVSESEVAIEERSALCEALLASLGEPFRRA